MQFERIRKKQKRKIIIGGLILVCIISAITITTSRAKYKLTEDIPLVRGTIYYKEPDMRVVAVNISEDGSNYIETDTVPTSGYKLNTTKSICKIAATDVIDEEITIEYKEGKVNILEVTKKGTRCYLYFDKQDEKKPIITNIETRTTKNEINVTVNATDNVEVTEYYYQLNDNTPVKQTTNTYKFIGLNTGTTYTIKVYVKDAAGNQSDTTTKNATTNKPTASEIILENITINSGTPNFSNVAEFDEGVYKISDQAYGRDSYYWRGAVTNNYVKFANKCWRIVRINGDGSIRLIYDGTTCHANLTSTAESIAVTEQAYNKSSSLPNSVGWTYEGSSQRTLSGTSSDAKIQLEGWYNNNIGNNATYSSKIADGKYCNDRNLQIGSNWPTTGSAFYYAGYKRLYTDYAPTLECNSGDIYTLKVGLITADEVELAGGKNADNKFYYLYNGQDYWTMSPYEYGTNNLTYVFCVRNDGQLGSDWVQRPTNGIRPVINLKSDTEFQAGGNGTLNNPYVVK